MPGDDSTSVDRIAISIPPFWSADSELWFAQIENQFLLADVTTDETKFSYVASHLDVKYAAEVRGILTKPPPTRKCVKLKTDLIGRLNASQDQKTRQLLSHKEMGDRRPSSRLASTIVPDDVLKLLCS